jgi:hypothetical protein
MELHSSSTEEGLTVQVWAETHEELRGLKGFRRADESELKGTE